MSRFLLSVGTIWMVVFCQPGIAAPLFIVAAENFYGSVAKEIGGSRVEVTSILNQPDQDPHLFNVTPQVAKHLAQADLVVYNGLGYDPWIQSLLSVHAARNRAIICVAKRLDKKEGDNPHIWYDPSTMPIYAKALLDFLSEKDPKHHVEYQTHYQQFIKNYQALTSLIAEIKARYPHTSVIATEPVFGYMAKALGFSMQGMAFQMSMMNGVDPTLREVQAFQNQLQQHRVSILFYNKQVSSPLVQHLVQLAKQSSIPVVGVLETQPSHRTYLAWMQDQLKQVEKALDERHRV